MKKRLFDIAFSFFLIILLLPVLIISYLLASFDTSSNGLFFQRRVGRHGKLFTIYKLKTIHTHNKTISVLGSWMRKHKLDELPQLINVLLGSMSIVGPRPDVEGYYDILEGDEKKLLELKPGITSLAALKYTDEEKMLSIQKDSKRYNAEVIFPDKVQMNLEYYCNRSIATDLRIILKTLRTMFK